LNVTLTLTHIEFLSDLNTEMVDEFRRKLPPFDASGIPTAQWGWGCMKSYDICEDKNVGDEFWQTRGNP
jgi:hypothetical protein